MIIDAQNDIYFDPRLGEIYAELEGGVFREFFFENEGGRIRHQFIKRPIPKPEGWKAGDVFDLTTPYGYGGPLVMDLESGGKDRLLAGFQEAFAEFCREEQIVSEFIRFHPVAENALDFTPVYEVFKFNRTVGINLAGYDDPVQAEFTKSARKTTRQALRAGLTFGVEENPRTLSDFMDIYYQTMDRNDADSRYYFDAAYFDAFIEKMPEKVLKCKVFYEGKVIAMGFYLRSRDILHTHLSGTVTDFLHLSPAYVLRYGLTMWGKEKGYALIHNGGGTSGDPADSLYRFKQKFGQHTEFDFYLGKKIWNPEVYEELTGLTGTSASSFFPQYRDQKGAGA